MGSTRRPAAPARAPRCGVRRIELGGALFEHRRFDVDVDADTPWIRAHHELGAHAAEHPASAQLRFQARDADGANARVRVHRDRAPHERELVVGHLSDARGRSTLVEP